MAIQEEADWSFSIKIHAILEATLNYALVHQLHNLDLGDLISKLPTSDMKSGKLAFVRSYGILPDNDCQFIRSISEIRNRMAHNSKHLGSTISDYVGSLESEKAKTNFFKYIAGVRFDDSDPDPDPQWQETAKNDPKRAIWRAATVILAKTVLRQQANELAEMQIKLKAERYDLEKAQAAQYWSRIEEAMRFVAPKAIPIPEDPH